MRRLDRAFDHLAGRGRRSDPEVVIDHLERRLAGEPIPVVVPGRFDMDKNKANVSSRRGLLIAAAAMAVVLAVAIPLWLVLGGDDSGVVAGQTTVTYPPTPAGKTPKATVEELVDQNYAALTNKDGAAARALNLDGVVTLIYAVDRSQAGRLQNLGPSYDPAEDVDQIWHVLGEFTTAGEVVAVPMRVEYPSEGEAVTGFDVWMVERYEGGLLCVGGTTFMALEPFVALDPAEVEDILAAQSAAWEAGDVDGVLVGYAPTATYLDGLEVHTNDWLRDYFGGVSLEYTGEPAFSGPFVAVPTRVTEQQTGTSTDGISVYWIRAGKIAHHAFSPGT
jgi:hypothetical protein